MIFRTTINQKGSIMKIRVAMLFGGKSVEHEVSVISGIQAYLNLDSSKYEAIPVYLTKHNEMYIGDQIGNIEAYKDIDKLITQSHRVILVGEEDRYYLEEYPVKAFRKPKKQEIDVVFPVVHGTNVEDGTLQGYLKTIGVPFVGCDVLSSAVGMDKMVMKTVLKYYGIPVLDGLTFNTSDYADVDRIIEKVESSFSFPVIVKPVNLGSSVGIRLAANRDELISAVDEAFCYSGRVLIEHAIEHLREINCSVLGDERKAEASECEEPIHTDEILSYKDKYIGNGKTKGAKSGGSKGMASASRKIPADLSPERREEIRETAVRAFKCLCCSGVSRLDFMIDEDTGKLYLNEINTIPGSLAFYLWEPLGVSFPELLDRMISLGLDRAKREKARTFSFQTNILSTAKMSGLKGAKA